MSAILLASTRTSAGKTTVGLGLGLLAQEQGKNVGYFKPLADRIVARGQLLYDRDAELFRGALDLREELDRLSLVHDYATLVQDYRREPKHKGKYGREEGEREGEGEDPKEQVLRRFAELAVGKELMLVEGPRNYSYGSFLNLSAGELAAALEIPVLLVANGGLGVVVDKALAAASYMQAQGARLRGVVINGVPQAELEEMERVAKPALEGRGLTVLGIVPRVEELALLTPRMVAEALGARVLAGEEGLDKRIENILVGAMTVDQALKGLRRYRNVALITGGDRTDMQLAAFEAGVVICLVLTGGIYPDPMVLSRADELEIPVLLVPEDTYTTAQRVEAAEPLIKPEEGEKLELVRELVEEHVAHGEIP